MDLARQHWVPRSYLATWCDPDLPPGFEPYVWRFPKDGGQGQRKAPKNIFWKTDFYTIHLPDGQRDLSLEYGLGTLETRFCQIRKTRIDNREPLSTEEKVWFCAFVAAMRFRTLAQRKAFSQQWRHALRIAEDLQRALDAMTPEQLQQYRSPRSLVETTGPSLAISDVKKLADQPIQHMLSTIIEEVLPVLIQMNLVIFTTEDDIGFITSDNPCVWFDPQGGRRPPMLQSRTIEVSMPVSPKSLALLCWENFPNYRSTRLFEVDEANFLQRLACHEYFVLRRNLTKPVWFT
jgi:hypothetical protein